MKNFKVGNVKMNMETNGFPKGFILKRELTLKECRYILKKFIGLDICDSDCFDDKWEYDSYNEELKKDVNKWLEGEREDDYIMQEYAGDCGADPMGVMNIIPIICWLKNKGIID